jgi:hypothetical protein
MDIDQRLLDEEPARLICPKCEKEYNRSPSACMETHMLR